MQKRMLGNSGLEIAPLASGGNPAQVALAWLIAASQYYRSHRECHHLDQLQDLTAATKLQPVPEDIEQLNQANAY